MRLNICAILGKSLRWHITPLGMKIDEITQLYHVWEILQDGTTPRHHHYHHHLEHTLSSQKIYMCYPTLAKIETGNVVQKHYLRQGQEMTKRKWQILCAIAAKNCLRLTFFKLIRALFEYH